MTIAILEIGSISKLDIQSCVVEHDGTMKTFMDKGIKEINNAEKLELMNAQLAADGSVVFEYFCRPMKKTITQYAVEIKEER